MLVLPEAVSDLFHIGTTHREHDDIENTGETSAGSSFARLHHIGGPGHVFQHHHHHAHRYTNFIHGHNGLKSSAKHGGRIADEVHTYRLLPIFSGIMIPFSLMLSIPSLTGHWYIRTGDHDKLIESRPNPPLLDVAMGFSMACGVLASACLIVRFAERRVKLMTILCIIFLTFHDLINIPAVTIFGIQHRFDDGFTYGQSFWFTVCSTMASTATNITLLTDFFKTKNFGHSGSGLTQKQRSLVIIIIVLLCYVSLGSLILAMMLHVTFLDALYLSVVSIESIGFGDLHPPSAGARVFMCFYICGGILNLAVAVALSRDALLESAAVGFRRRLQAAETRQRERHIRTRWRAAVRWRVRAKGHPVWVDDRDEERRQRVGLKRRHHWYSRIRSIWRRLWDEVWREWEDPAWKYVYGKRHRRLNLEALTLPELETAALEAGAPLSELVPKGIKLRPQKANNAEDSERMTSPNTQFPTFETKSSTMSSHSLTNVRMGGMVSLVGRFAIAVTHGVHHDHRHHHGFPKPHSNSDEEEEEDESISVRRGRLPFIRGISALKPPPESEVSLAESLQRERRNAFRARLTVALTLFIVFWVVGSVVFMQTEGWTFGSAVYFCFISFTTVGYGDLSPQTPAGRSIFVVWALMGVGTMTILISILAEAYSNQYKSVINSGGFRASVPFEHNSETHSKQAGSSPNLHNATSPADNQKSLYTSDVLFSADGLASSSSTLAASYTSSRYGGSRRPSMTPIPEMEHSYTGHSLSRRRGLSTDKAKITNLSRDVLYHVDTLRSLLTAAPENVEEVLAQMDKSVQNITNVVNEYLKHDSP